MKIRKSQQGGVWIIGLIGPLVRGRGLHRVRDAVEPLVRRGHRRVVLDLTAATYADAAGLGELVRADRRVRGRGGRLVLAAVPGSVRRALQVTGLTDSLTVAERLADALALLRGGAIPSVARRVGRHVLVGEVWRSPGIIRRAAEGSCRRYTPIPG